MMDDSGTPHPVRSALLDEISADSRISHGFFNRTGGVSKGLYRGLNVGLGSSDDRNDVMENRARVSRWFELDIDRLVTVHQVHSPRVQIATPENRNERPQADALVTSTPGWRGALDGVLESTVAAMQGLGARTDRIVAVLGPSISQDNYEVGPEFVDRFLQGDPASEIHFKASAKPGHALFDLRRFTLDRLRTAGLKAEMLADCTYADEAAWYSYRRATHRNEPDYGRQISAIAIKEDAHGPAF